jgi:hypothetical protein
MRLADTKQARKRIRTLLPIASDHAIRYDLTDDQQSRTYPGQTSWQSPKPSMSRIPTYPGAPSGGCANPAACANRAGQREHWPVIDTFNESYVEQAAPPYGA